MNSQRIVRLIYTFAATSLICLQTSEAQIQYDYTHLYDKDMPEMQKLIEQPYADIKEQMESSHFDAMDYLVEFQSATRIAMSRPDYDSTRANAFAPTYSLLREFRIVEVVVKRLVDEAIAAIQAPQTSPMDKTTYMVILENLIHEFKPRIGSNTSLRQTFEKIRDAKLKTDDKTKNFQLLRSMKVMQSPSDRAGKVLLEIPARAPDSESPPVPAKKASSKNSEDIEEPNVTLKKQEDSSRSKSK